MRYGRVPKRSRERAESLESTGSADGLSEAPVEVDPAVEQQQLLDMIAGVTAAHRAHCNYTEEATRDTVRRPAGQAIAQARARVSTRNPYWSLLGPYWIPTYLRLRTSLRVAE